MRAGQGLREHLQRGMPVVCSAWPGVQAVGDAVELVLAEGLTPTWRRNAREKMAKSENFNRYLVEGSVCTIRGVSVEPACQGHGIGASLLHAIEQAHPTIERFGLTTNTLVPGNVSFYGRRGYQVTELTRYTDKIVSAQLAKVRITRGT